MSAYPWNVGLVSPVDVFCTSRGDYACRVHGELLKTRKLKTRLFKSREAAQKAGDAYVRRLLKQAEGIQL